VRYCVAKFTKSYKLSSLRKPLPVCITDCNSTLRYGKYIPTADSLIKGIRDKVIKREELGF
jgi:hypothetical protein